MCDEPRLLNGTTVVLYPEQCNIQPRTDRANLDAIDCGLRTSGCAVLHLEGRVHTFVRAHKLSKLGHFHSADVW